MSDTMTDPQRRRLSELGFQGDSDGVRAFQRAYNRINKPKQPISVSGVVDARTATAIDAAYGTAPAFRLALGALRNA